MEKKNNKKQYLVDIKTIIVDDDGNIYGVKESQQKTFAVSKKQAENNVRFRTIGAKYKTINRGSGFYTKYEFEANEIGEGR